MSERPTPWTGLADVLPYVRRVLERAGADPFEGDDLAHDVLIRVARHRAHAPTEPRAFRRWIALVTRRVFFTYCKRVREPWAATEQELRELTDTLDVHEEVETREYVHVTLARLTVAESSTLRRYYWGLAGPLSNAEKIRVHRARRAFRSARRKAEASDSRA